MSTIARLSLAEYDRMIAAEVFDPRDPRRIEFIRGELRELTPPGPIHEDLIDRLNRWSVLAAVKHGFVARVQNSIGVRELESAPQPDIAWVRPGDYALYRPLASDVLLLVEVSHSTLHYDRGEKARLYAEAGVPEYWIVNVPDRVVELRRAPQGPRFTWAGLARPGEEIAPQAFPEATLKVAELLG